MVNVTGHHGDSTDDTGDTRAAGNVRFRRTPTTVTAGQRIEARAAVQRRPPSGDPVVEE